MAAAAVAVPAREGGGLATCNLYISYGTLYGFDYYLLDHLTLLDLLTILRAILPQLKDRSG